jgi:PhnB protein
MTRSRPNSPQYSLLPGAPMYVAGQRMAGGGRIRALRGDGHYQQREEGDMAVIPYLYYEDVSSAMTFVAKAFGFRPFGARARGENGRIIHAAMKAGSNVVMMGRPPMNYRNPAHLGQATQCLLVNVRNLDQHFAQAVKAGARVLEEPGDTPFGTRRYGVADPEGHEWYFSQPRKRSARPVRKRSAKAVRRRPSESAR